MRFLFSLANLIRNLIRRKHVERDLDEEVSSYLDLLTREKMRDGLGEKAARRAASIEFGGREQLKETVREARFGYFLETRVQDLRYALRSLRKALAFSLTVALVLALGIGSTVLMFAIVDSVLVKGRPFRQADRLFTLWQRIPQEPRVSFSPKEFTGWQRQTEVFENLAFAAGTGFTISGRGDPELVIGRMVTPAFFQVLRTNPSLGRAFATGEANERLVVLSHACGVTNSEGAQTRLENRS